MSDRKRPDTSETKTIHFEPVVKSPDGVAAEAPAARPSQFPADTPAVLFGVLFPLAVIAIEWATGLCAQAFFDPLPTLAHAVLVGLVPLANLIALVHLRKNSTALPGWLPVLTGVSLAVSAFYALIFFPLMPLAVVAVLFYGLGLLPMGPVIAFMTTLRLKTRLAQRHGDAWRGRPVKAGIAIGLAALLLLDVPAAATRIGLTWAVSTNATERERGVALLRALGDQDLLLRLCYDTVGRPTGLLSFLVTFGSRQVFDGGQVHLANSVPEVREIFYRTYGIAFNTLPAPLQKGRWAQFGDFTFDPDHGGTEVGGRIKGLDLVSSRIDGSVNGDSAVGYLEWVLEFRNTSALAREARVGFALPPGAVVSRATLWINGVEQEAAYGGRGEVRKAYQEVAIRQARDPLLVTTKGAGRVLAQAFPVPSNGTIKFKIGITSPMTLTAANRAEMALPAIFERNFNFPDGVRHAVWIEGKSMLSASAGGLNAAAIAGGGFRLEGFVTDADLAKSRPIIVAERDARVITMAAQAAGNHGTVVQTIVNRTAVPTSALMIVVDGSRSMERHRTALRASLETIPEGRFVGLAIASEPALTIAPSAWTPDHARKIRAALDATSFRGGQDNAPVLAEAVKLLEGEPGGALLWIHGPQPVAFRASQALLDQISTRLTRFPNVALYPVEPGANEVLPDAPWAWGGIILPNSGSTHSDLEKYLSQTLSGKPSFAIKRTLATASHSAPLALGSSHIAKLWAADEVNAMMANAGEAARANATSIAADHRLVTPVSGAVVLETKAQYSEHNLQPVATATVPTVPEPHEWAMIIIVSCLVLWTLYRQQPTHRGVA